MMIEQFEVQDQIEANSNKFIESVIEQYNLKGNRNAEIKVRHVCPQGKEHPSDDTIIEILLKDKLIAMQYQRRTDANWTEVTNIKL